MGTADSQERITSSYFPEKRVSIHFIALEKGYQSLKEQLQYKFLKFWTFYPKVKKKTTDTSVLETNSELFSTCYTYCKWK